MEKLASKIKKNIYYILRHGYTTRDEKGEMIVSSDVKADKYHLTEEGKEQAQKAAELIKNNHEIDLIYSSPFLRTKETAEAVSKLLHLKVNIDDRIREIEHGGCEGNPYYSCPFKDKRKGLDDRPHETGETWNDVRKRMYEFMKDIEEKHSGKKILIVSHGDPLWFLKSVAQAKTGQEILNEGDISPKIAGFEELKWRQLPRNEYGELDLHRPFVDEVVLKCGQCKASMKKVSDLIDVWFDSGAMPYAQWHWPFENEKIFKEQFPADFIVEAMDQTRGWFYTLLAIATLLGKGNPYKNVVCYSHVLDEKGKKMSKSKGNVVSPFEVMDKVGADAARWYFYTINQPGEYKNFSIKDAEAKLKGFIFTLQNCVRFYELYAIDKATWIHETEPKELLDKWVLSKLHGLVKDVTESLDNYDPTTAARAIERFIVEDLSNWWLRRSRKRKAASPSVGEPRPGPGREALGLLRFILLHLSKVLAPFTPFMAEDIKTRLHKFQKAGHESVHLNDWPLVDKKLINKKLEEEMEEVRNIVTAGLAVRKEKQIKVRQPLQLATIKRSEKFQSGLEELVKEELNVKEVKYDGKQEAEVILNTELTQALEHEGYAREWIRQIQDMRKEAKYKLDEKVYGQWHSDDKELSEAIRKWSEEIKSEALLSDFVNRQKGNKTCDIEKEFELAPQRKIWVGVKK